MRLTKTQEGILNAEEIVGGAVSNICGATFFTRHYSTEELNAAVNTLLRINDALRLHIDYRTKTQWVEEYSWHIFETVCFDEQSDYERYAKEYASTQFDSSVSLFNLKIVMIRERTGLLYVLHHAVCDAWSLSVLRWQLHQILEEGIVPPSYSFSEYCRRASDYPGSKRYKDDRAYFLDRFHRNKDRLLPLDPPVRDFGSRSLTLELPSDLTAAISRYAEKSGVSLFVLLLAAFGICYSKMHDDAECFYIGTTVLNRTTQKDLHTIGPFIDDIPLLFDIQPGQTAGDFLRGTDEIVFNGFRHHRFNYPMLQEAIRREAPNPRLYDVIFNYQAEYETLNDFPAEWFYNGMQYEALQIHIDHRNDLTKRMVSYNYQLDSYTESDILRLHRHYVNVLTSIITDDSQLIRDISLMDKAELADLETLSRGRTSTIPGKSLYHLIEEQQNGGVIDGENEYSIDNLKRDAEKIDSAVRSNKRVIAVISDRGYAELAAIYGVIRGGNAYLPISPEYPPERIDTILKISTCDTVLAQRKYRFLAENALVIEDILEAPAVSPALPVAAAAEDLLYVIFTSGSTGLPKGAMISNRSAVNRIRWMAEQYFSPETVVMLKTPYTFDVSVWEIFGFAVGGFKLYILPPFDHYRQDRVIEHINKGNVTDIHFVPSVFSSFLDVLENKKEQLHSLKNIFLSGEALPASLVRRAPASVHNLYGPTECAVDVTYYDCTGTETDPVPIGYPIDNCRMYILNRHLQPVPQGVKGQICIAGTPVGTGYINDPLRTSERFVRDPAGEGMLYLTGDLGYWNNDGAIVYIGRNDRQVKINGQRIEPEEIETALLQLVPNAAVIVEDNRLIAFYSGAVRPSLREEMSSILPRYMVPHMFIHVEEMPLMPNGKINRKALKQIPREESQFEPPENETEKLICTLFSEVLHKECIGRSDSFFDLGGTSLDMLELLSRAPLDKLSPADFMMHSSPRELAGLLAGFDNTGSLTPLYIPECHYCTGIILFPYAGGDASAYTALVSEFRNRHAPAALYYVSWDSDLDEAEIQIRKLSESNEIVFYSHCAGSVIAMKLLDKLNARQTVIRRYVAGANIPPLAAVNIWKTLSDRDLLDLLYRAGMPKLPDSQRDHLISRFRSNTEEYFNYLNSHGKKTPCTADLILSRNDLFTPDLQNARKNWEQYVVNVGSVKIIDTPTHYFQSEKASSLADFLLSEDGLCFRE